MLDDIARNPGTPLDITPFREIDAREIERRADGYAEARLRGEARRARLRRAVEMVDLTTLSGDDTPARVRDLCAEARAPLDGAADVHVAAVCVYPLMVPHAVRALHDSEIPVASVAAGFPHGLTPPEVKEHEIQWAVLQGAREIDVVITRAQALLSDWEVLHAEIARMRRACGEAHMKVILSTGELGDYGTVYAAAAVAMQAGADFVKTSTGKETVNATLPVGVVMARAVRDYHAATGYKVGFKPAGGISTCDDAIQWMALIEGELGEDWLTPALFRFGASSLLGRLRDELT